MVCVHKKFYLIIVIFGRRLSYIMVSSLEEITRCKIKRREAYEKRYSAGSYERNELAKYSGKTVNVSATLDKINGFQVTFIDVVINGISYDHINVFISPKAKNYSKLVSSLSYKPRVSFISTVESYFSNNRKAWGISGIKKLKFKSVEEKVQKFVGLRSYGSLDFSLSVVNKGQQVEEEGFSSILKGMPQISDLGKTFLINSILTKVRKSYGVCSKVEDELTCYFGRASSLRSVIRAYVAGNMSGYFSEDSLRFKVSSLMKTHSNLRDSIDKGVSQSFNYINFWTDSLSYYALPVPSSLTGLYSVPAVFEREDGKVLVILPYFSTSGATTWRTDSLLKIVNEFNISADTEVTLYNPIRNRYRVVRTK